MHFSPFLDREKSLDYVIKWLNFLIKGKTWPRKVLESIKLINKKIQFNSKNFKKTETKKG